MLDSSEKAPSPMSSSAVQQRQRQRLPRDPKVSIEKANEVELNIVKEKVAAGIPAFQFDPDAPTAEKVEQVREGVEEDPMKSDPRTAGEGKKSSPAESESQLMTSVKSKATASIRQQVQDPFAPDRTGWAPRFYDAAKDGIMNDADDTLLDHQTWLETKIDDKFYGGAHNGSSCIARVFS
ncbi:hypothetical protein KEM54_000739 [Ascosphaera aggregata]|nr:hypothetical protein KEM54_000739 [Ascosphaera aggregata]